MAWLPEAHENLDTTTPRRGLAARLRAWWPAASRRRPRGNLRSAEEVRAMVDAQMAEFYGVTTETAAEARKLWWADSDEHEPDGRYDFSQYMTWLALQMIQELGPSITGAELLEKYRHYLGGKP